LLVAAEAAVGLQLVLLVVLAVARKVQAEQDLPRVVAEHRMLEVLVITAAPKMVLRYREVLLDRMVTEAAAVVVAAVIMAAAPVITAAILEAVEDLGIINPEISLPQHYILVVARLPETHLIPFGDRMELVGRSLQMELKGYSLSDMRALNVALVELLHHQVDILTIRLHLRVHTPHKVVLVKYTKALRSLF
jgi:hypothetical protein